MAGVRHHNNIVPASNGSGLAFFGPLRAGTTLKAVIVSTVTSEGVTGITDGHSNTWTEDVDTTVGAFRFEIWSAPNGTSGTTTAAVTWSAFTGSSKRVWLVEILSVGSLTDGASDTHDQAGAEDPLTLASLTSAGKGVALLVVATDTAHSFSSWSGDGVFLDMSGGTSSRAAYSIIDDGESLAPLLEVSATETGESLLMAFYDSGGGGGGETAHVFS